jgi:hypothetical protein
MSAKDGIIIALTECQELNKFYPQFNAKRTRLFWTQNNLVLFALNCE